MHGSCVKLLRVPLAQHALSVAEHACIKSTYMQPCVGFVCVIKNGFCHCLLMRKLFSWSC